MVAPDAGATPGPGTPSGSPARASWWRRAAANLLLLGLSCLLAVGAGELIVRLAAPQQLIEVRPDIWQPADSLGWLFRPSISTTINTGERTVHVFTDADGLRVGRQGRRDAPTRVLLLGDSFLAALQVEYEQSIPALLEQALSARIGRPVSVWNAGVAGWGPSQYLVRGRALLARERFDAVVVLLYVGNDVVAHREDYSPPLAPTRIAEWRLPRTLTRTEVVEAWLRPANDFLERRSHLFVLLKTRLDVMLMRAGLTADYFPVEFRRSEATSSRWEVTAGTCREIADAAARHGLPTLFVLLPTPFQVAPETFREYVAGFGIDTSTVDLDQPTRLLRERLAAAGLWVVDPLPEFRAAAAAGTALYGTVDRHFSPEGHALLSALVAPVVADSLLARPAKREAGPAR